MENRKLLFALLSNVVCGTPVSEAVKDACTPERLEVLYDLAKQHDLAHLVGQAVSKMDLPKSEVYKKCTDSAFLAFYRYAQLNYEYESICKLLEAEKIPFIPLKGSVLRDYYPEAWMRTSCDIDILVQKDMLEVAAKALMEKLHYQFAGKGSHDISLYSEGNVHLELHYTTIEEKHVVQSEKVLRRFWDSASPVEGYQYRMAVPDEMFFFYHIAHMAKHVENGGCGIRPFLDLWILERRVEFDASKREQLLQEGGLLTFTNVARNVAAHWFSATELEDALSAQFERFILEGGVYGTIKNKAAVNRRKKGGIKYIFSAVFISNQALAYLFPVVEKHKWLGPLFQVVRWVKLLSEGKLKQGVQDIQIKASVSAEEEMTAGRIMKHLGLE